MWREEMLENPEELTEQLKKLEKHEIENTVTLVEILSNVVFFGGLKMDSCEYAREGQCSFYFIEDNIKKKLPIVDRCRIKNCKEKPGHHHLKLSNMACTFCPMWQPK